MNCVSAANADVILSRDEGAFRIRWISIYVAVLCKKEIILWIQIIIETTILGTKCLI